MEDSERTTSSTRLPAEDTSGTTRGESSTGGELLVRFASTAFGVWRKFVKVVSPASPAENDGVKAKACVLSKVQAWQLRTEPTTPPPAQTLTLESKTPSSTTSPQHWQTRRLTDCKCLGECTAQFWESRRDVYRQPTSETLSAPTLTNSWSLQWFNRGKQKDDEEQQRTIAKLHPTELGRRWLQRLQQKLMLVESTGNSAWMQDNETLKPVTCFIVEVDYLLRGEVYKVLYTEGIEFPPWKGCVSETDAPLVRLFPRDILQVSLERLSIDCDEEEEESSDNSEEDYKSDDGQSSLSEEQHLSFGHSGKEEEEDDDNSESDEGNMLEEPNLQLLLRQLRGPGRQLFHQGACNFVCSVEDVRLFIKAVYVENLRQQLREMQKSVVGDRPTTTNMREPDGLAGQQHQRLEQDKTLVVAGQSTVSNALHPEDLRVALTWKDGTVDVY